MLSVPTLRLRLGSLLFLAAALVSAVRAQDGSSVITGFVLDSQGATIPSARVEARNLDTKVVYPTVSTGSGVYTIPLIPGGTYELWVTRSGFESARRRLEVPLGNRVQLDIGLTLASVTQTMKIVEDDDGTGEPDNSATRLTIGTSQHAFNINGRQVNDMSSRGRNYLDVLRSLPGVQTTTSNDSRGILGQSPPTINGGQQGQFLVTIGGITAQDSTAPSTGGYITPSVDAIAEAKVLISNYNAEYGARAGGLFKVTVKSGTTHYRGSLYYYLRHEQFDANEWFNNATSSAKPRYRYVNPGGTLGGPLVIPSLHLDRRRNLFFFFSEDFLHNRATGAQNKYTMPSAIERKGDYSQTVTSGGMIVPILDPASGKQFAGNLIPSSRISPQGYALLNLFPLPFASDPTGQRQYNAIYQFTTNNPREDRLLRVDWSASPSTIIYALLNQDYAGNEGNGTAQGPQGSGWGQLPAYFDSPSVGMSLTAVHTFRPNLISETMWGVSHGSETAGPMDSGQYAADLLPALRGPAGQAVTLPTAIPGANAAELDPKISFLAIGAQSAGQLVTNPPAFGWGGFWPFWGHDILHTITNNTTWVKGHHTVAAGAYWEHDYRSFAVDGNYMGQYWFGSDVASAVDTGYAYSNALLGSVQASQQDGARQFTFTHYNQFEWFAQDTWRATRRLTLDIGVRFQLPGPSDNRGATMGVFSGAAYDPSKSGQLLYPAMVAGQKVALNPVTGATYSSGRINSLDPASYPAGGTPYSGIVQYQNSFFHWPGIGVGPRVGFAWDVFGNGKTALRGGFGITYGRAYNPNLAQNLQKVPPGYRSLTFYNTTFATLLSTQATLTAIAAPAGSPDYPNPSANNWSIGVQRDLGKGFITDIAYVGNVAHHQFSPAAIDSNAVAPYTTWSPTRGVNTKYQDPTNATGGLYNANLIRALSGGYAGYAALSTFTSAGESSYNALQVQINRRFGRRFQMGTNYTWSKTITFARQQWIPDVLTKNVANRPHAVNINFGFALPNGSAFWKSEFAKHVLDGWNLSGVGSYYVGTPMTINCAASNVPANLGNYWTGTPTGGVPFRCQMTGNLWLSDGTTPGSNGSNADPRLWYPFNAGGALSTNPGFVLPPATSLGFGNTPPTLTYGPGFENWDLSLYKEIRLGKETRVLQLRVDTFNTFNHFNPGNPNTSLTYNFVTGAQTNANFGTVTAAQNQARHASVSVKLRF